MNLSNRALQSGIFLLVGILLGAVGVSIVAGISLRELFSPGLWRHAFSPREQVAQACDSKSPSAQKAQQDEVFFLSCGGIY